MRKKTVTATRLVRARRALKAIKTAEVTRAQAEITELSEARQELESFECASSPWGDLLSAQKLARLNQYDQQIETRLPLLRQREEQARKEANIVRNLENYEAACIREDEQERNKAELSALLEAVVRKGSFEK